MTKPIAVRDKQFTCSSKPTENPVGTTSQSSKSLIGSIPRAATQPEAGQNYHQSGRKCQRLGFSKQTYPHSYGSPSQDKQAAILCPLWSAGDIGGVAKGETAWSAISRFPSAWQKHQGRRWRSRLCWKLIKEIETNGESLELFQRTLLSRPSWRNESTR